MGRVRKQPVKPATASKDSPPKRKRGRPRKKTLATPRQDKETVAKGCPTKDADGNPIISLPCGHNFHEKCFKKGEECPACVKSLEHGNAKNEANESNGNGSVSENEAMESKTSDHVSENEAMESSSSDHVSENEAMESNSSDNISESEAIESNSSDDVSENEDNGQLLALKFMFFMWLMTRGASD